MKIQGPPMYLMSWKMVGDTKRALFSIPQSDGVWYAETKTPTDKGQNINPWQWDVPPRLIDPQQMSVPWNPSMTFAVPGYDAYVKSLDFLDLGSRLFDVAFQIQRIAITQREIYTCEFLRRYPHPYLCAYRGVTVDRNGIVSALVFDRYDTTLHALVRDRKPFDADACLTAVQTALKHLHNLGYIHFDCHPGNIFYNKSTRQFVLGDFDTAQFIDTPLQIKYGAPGWRVEIPKHKVPTARVEHDWYGFEVLKLWMKRKGSGMAGKHDLLPSTNEIMEEAKEMLKNSKLALACM